MVNPRTVNTGIIVPLTGSDVDLWGEQDVNPNMVAIDGLFSGVQTIAVTGAAPLTLSAPAGFTATPGPGPTQSQNRVLRFSGVLTATQQVQLPLPGVYVIENNTTGNFVLYFGGLTLTEVVSVDQGTRQTIYNDGANVRFVDMPRVGTMEFWAGITAMPLWATNCTVKPYLLCDGSLYNFASFPYLGAKMVGSFGGNGVTTFCVPDMRGRYPLAYDSTGSRVTAGECGINGQTMGAALQAQSVTLNSTQMPSHYHSAGIYDPTHSHIVPVSVSFGASGSGAGIAGAVSSQGSSFSATGVRVNSSNGLDTTYSAGGGGSHNNMPNTQVAGIWVIKT